MSAKLIPHIRDNVTSHIKSNWAAFSSLFPGIQKEKLEDLVNAQMWDFSVEWCQSQCTELFCDFCGLLLFGRSYLHTFSYLLSPNLGGARSPLYPSMNSRARYIAQAAKALAVTVDANYASAFIDEEVRLPGRDAFLLEVVDKATEALVPRLIDEICDIRDELKLTQSKPGDENPVRTAFEQLVPAQNARSLQSVVNVAWDAKDDPDLWKFAPELQGRKVEIINDLLLKTLEVMEYEAILGEPDAFEDK